MMNITYKRAIGALTALVLLAMSGCADMSRRDRNTVAGAAIGGVAGSVLSNGSGLGAVGGAALGGYIGNQMERPRH